MDLQQTIYVKIYFVSLLYSVYCECVLSWDSNMFLSSIVCLLESSLTRTKVLHTAVKMDMARPLLGL